MSSLVLSAFSDEYDPSFEKQLRGMRGFGISHVELRFLNKINVSALTAEQVGEAKRMLEHYGIKVSAIGSPLGKIKLDGDLREHLDTAKRIFELAEYMGAEFIRVFSFYAPVGEDITKMKDAVVDELGKLIEAARSYPVTLCHENEAKIYGDTPVRCRELLDSFGGELKCVFDMGNFVLEGVSPYPEAYELLKKDIAYFHIKDALGQGAIVPPGKGDAAIKEILNAHSLYSEKDFFVSLEPHLQTFSGLNALVGRSFDNPYKYSDEKTAFEDAVNKFRELMKI
ncbi:MAG: sugar phosphate isomerase/epimerase [Ruminococcaceae bacterium]|nr:sugar phosphate isomerase/epimerase [Oscillospiraceae bacterium]